MFPATTAVTGTRNVVRRQVLVIFSSYSSSVSYVFSESIKVSVADCGWKQGAEPRRLNGIKC